MSYQSRMQRAANINSLWFTENILLRKNHKNLHISEVRHIEKVDYINGKSRYFVTFEYTLIKKPNFWHKNSRVAKITIKDQIKFYNLEEAESYVQDASCPSVQVSGGDYYHRLKIYFKNLQNINGLNVYALQESRESETKYAIYYGYSGTTKYKYSDVWPYILEEYGMLFPATTQHVSTIEINDIVNIKKIDIDKIQENIDKSKNGLAPIIVNEINRYNEYIEVLKKLL